MRRNPVADSRGKSSRKRIDFIATSNDIHSLAGLHREAYRRSPLISKPLHDVTPFIITLKRIPQPWFQFVRSVFGLAFQIASQQIRTRQDRLVRVLLESYDHLSRDTDAAV